MKPLITGLFAGLLLAHAAAYGHGGTRQKVVESLDIDAPPEAVWAIVGNFADAAWLPAVQTSHRQSGNSAVRELVLKKGGTLEEELKDYDAEHQTIKYRAHKDPDCAVFPVNNYSATIRVQAQGQGSRVEWLSAAYRCFTPNNPPPGQDEKAAVEAMGAWARDSLAELKRLAEQANAARAPATPPSAQTQAPARATATAAQPPDEGGDSGKV